MNTETLKSLIVELRDKEGLTYQAIADLLSSQYGEVRSRQSIHSMYKSAKKEIEDSKSIDSTEEYIFNGDVLNLAAFGYFNTEIKEELENIHDNVTYYRIGVVVKNNKDAIDFIRSGIIDRIKEVLPETHYYRELENYLIYKQWPIKERVIKKYVKDVFKDRIVDLAREEIRKLEGFIDDGGEIAQLKAELKKVNY